MLSSVVFVCRMFPWFVVSCFVVCVLVLDLVVYQRGSLPGGWPTRGVAPQFSFPPCDIWCLVLICGFSCIVFLLFIINLVFTCHSASRSSLLSPPFLVVVVNRNKNQWQEMCIASAEQLGDHSQQKMKTNLSICQRTTQFTERSNFTHKLAAAAPCWK